MGRHPRRVAPGLRVHGSTGDFEGLAPTGNAVDITFCNVMRVADDKVITERDYFDTHGLLEQLGVT